MTIDTTVYATFNRYTNDPSNLDDERELQAHDGQRAAVTLADSTAYGTEPDEIRPHSAFADTEGKAA